jgi:hypothetical protein
MGAMVAGLNPGQMAYQAVGIAGAVAVVVAGWTTANPTMYRAGLALQIATPNWPRWKVTLAAGAVTTVVACFPVFFMRLLGFVAIYGILLMPIGAIVFVEHWLFPRLGLRRYWAQQRGRLVNGPALVTWLATLAACWGMGYLDVHLNFRWLPGWFIAAFLYVGLCRVWPSTAGGPAGEPAPVPEAPVAGGFVKSEVGARPRAGGIGHWLFGGVALLALVACLVLPFRVFLGDPGELSVNLAAYQKWFLVASVVYFVSAVAFVAGRERRLA